MRENFLPLHRYMFNTKHIERKILRYDETLERLEDLDVLLSVAQKYPVSGFHRRRLIGLYNFYTVRNDGGNTTENIFAATSVEKRDIRWQIANRTIFVRHGGKPWKEYWGEEWEAPLPLDDAAE